MDKKPVIVFSTVTGNALKLAQAAAEVIPEHRGPYNIRYIREKDYPIQFVTDADECFDTFVLTYWCDKGTADKDTIDFIKSLHGKKIIMLGSLGVARDTQHAADVVERVNALVKEENVLLGHFLCQGAIDLGRTANKLTLPEGQRGHLTPDRFERQKLSQGHPDEQDLRDLKSAVVSFLRQSDDK